MHRVREKEKRRMVLGLTLFILLASFPISALSTQNAEDLKIRQTDRTILVDGNLDDWEGIEERPIDLTAKGEQIQPSSDLSVTALFTYDSKNFYAAVKVLDDIFEFPNRSWRYGDGFILTFVDPIQGNESDRFTSFGISLEDEKTVALIVNKDGVYFPGIDVRDMKVKIVKDAKKGEIHYEVAIPFKYLVPFKPFIQEKWGINLIYADRDQEERTLVFLYPDPNYDTELSDKRRGAIFQFIHHVPKEPEIQMSLSTTHFYDDEEKSIILAILSPDEMSGWQITSILLGPSARNVHQSEEITLKKGMNLLHFNLESRDYATGPYDLSIGVINDKDTLRFKEDDRFYVLNRSEFEQFQKKFDEIKKSKLATEDEKFRKSLSNLEIRFDWIKEYMDEAPPFIGIESIEEWYDEIKTLSKNVEEGKPAVFPLGSIGRYAHRSAIDDTLQPYTVYIPQDYNEKYPTPLFVTLHGSGVNEVRYAYNIAMVLGAGRFRGGIPKMIMIAPQARGLSDWYIGNSGKDVLECIDHIKALYNIDEENIILDGFSMGGYGAWRLSLLHPDLFKAVIIRSGPIVPPPYVKGENILDLMDKLMDKGKNLDFFIVHGAKDNAVPVENARRAVQKLKELGISYKYIEIKDAYHTGYDKWGEIFEWLRSIIKVKGGEEKRPERRIR
jgi:predicted esterase